MGFSFLRFSSLHKDYRRIEMYRTVFWAARHLTTALLIVAISFSQASAQATGSQAGSSSGGEQDRTELTKKLDELVEQNQKLEQQAHQVEEQNQKLLDEIREIRQEIAVLPAESKPASSPPAKKNQTPQKPNDTAAQDKAKKDQEIEQEAMWGQYTPGAGYTVAKTETGSLNISAYMVARYLNQLPAHQTGVDHLGRPLLIKPRQDFQLHRVMVFLQGFLFNPKFQYMTFLWTVNDTTQVAIGGALTYNFNRHFVLSGGWNGLPGTRSIQGSHPYWPSYDRVMADEFFRPFFTQGIFAAGEVVPRLYYRAMLGNNLSNLGAAAVKLTRDLSVGASLTWIPTTGEFGPRGAFGDFEHHEKLATRFGTGYTRSPEDRRSELSAVNSENTTIRLGDSLNVFDTGSVAPGVTVLNATYHLNAADAGIKYRGFWLQGEGYYRLLNGLIADKPLPISNIRDYGFYVQTAYMVVPKTIEIYADTSWVYTDYAPKGSGPPHEYLVGLNWYPAHNRNYRLNFQVIDVDHSPVSSTFGFYTGGLKGPIVALGATAFF
jgi:cell division protein FtsB